MVDQSDILKPFPWRPSRLEIWGPQQIARFSKDRNEPGAFWRCDLCGALIPGLMVDSHEDDHRRHFDIMPQPWE